MKEEKEQCFSIDLGTQLFFFSFRLNCFAVALTKLTPLAGATAVPSIHSFPGELEELQSVLHFPEEVALRITDAEYQLFYQVNSQQRKKKQVVTFRNFHSK